MYTSSVPDGRAANHAFSVVTLRPPIAAPFPGAAVRVAVIGSPASVVEVTRSGVSAARVAFSARVAGASTRAYQDSPNRETSSACSCEGERPVTAWISEAVSYTHLTLPTKRIV